MNLSRKTTNALIAGAFAITMYGASTTIANAEGSKEKCYGVVKAGKNGCASADGKHSCQGYATVDGSGQEWIAVPEGLCEKLVGGSTEPYTGDAPEKE